jgi:hypothetical protein
MERLRASAAGRDKTTVDKADVVKRRERVLRAKE